MITCPKCSSIRISGPRFVRLRFNGEALRYSCNQCGYEHDEAPHDAITATWTRGEQSIHHKKE